MPWVMVHPARRHASPPLEVPDAGRAAKLASLLKKSQGVPARLTRAERADVRLLVRKLEPLAMVRSVAPIGKRALGGKR